MAHQASAKKTKTTIVEMLFQVLLQNKARLEHDLKIKSNSF